MRKPAFAAVALLSVTVTVSLFAQSSLLKPRKRTKSDWDVNAIGTRKLTPGFGPAQLKKEQELGEKLASDAASSAMFVVNGEITGYLTGIAENIALNSDADMAIHIRILDRSDANYCVLPGGYHYVTRGLLLRMQSEGELASLLARGVAHTALHTPMKELKPEYPPVPIELLPMRSSVCLSENKLYARDFEQASELDADFFGIQYVYKAGYDSLDFIQMIQQLWGNPATNPKLVSLDARFPRLPERIKLLHKEIIQVLPVRNAAVFSTSDFENFEEHLRAWKSQERPLPTFVKQGVPTLVRPDSDSK